jgi:hypothetical protein
MTLDTKSIRERAKLAHAEVSRMCNGKRWTMCIPVEPDDSDITIDNALRDVPALCDEVEDLRAALAKAERERDEARAALEAYDGQHVHVTQLPELEAEWARVTFEATREKCIHEARAAKAVWSDNCAHERMAAQEACDYIASAIQAYVKPADVLGTPPPATKPCDLCGETDGHTKRCSHTKWPATNTGDELK